MKIEFFRHENVNAFGICDGGGSVSVEGNLVFSEKKGGCGLNACKCSEGHWFSVVAPRTKDGTVDGVKFEFESNTEMEDFLSGIQHGIENRRMVNP